MSEMDIALREREIAIIRTRRQYKHVKEIVDNSLSCTSVQQLVLNLENLHICVNDWEKSQFKVERLVEPINLEEEVNKACDIRSKLSGFIHKIENAITDKRISEQLSASPVTPPNIAAPSFRGSINSRTSLLDDSNSTITSALPPLHIGQGVTPLLNSTQLNIVAKKPVNSKLGKVQLVEFEGNREDFPNFWDVFDDLVHQTDMSNVNKFIYLKNCLKGRARNAIQGFSITHANYPEAIAVLHKRFNDPDIIIDSHIHALLTEIVTPTRSDPNKYVDALWTFYDEVVGHVRSLEALGIDGHAMQLFLCPMILAKLPEELRLDWFKKTRKKSDIEVLLNFIEEYITSLDQTKSALMKESSHKTSKPSALALHTNSNKTNLKCSFCKIKGHAVITCRKFLALDNATRYSKAGEIKVCYKCLQTSPHKFVSCKATCSDCGGKHHKLLCRGQNVQRSNGTLPGGGTNGPSVDSNVSNTTSNPSAIFGASNLSPNANSFNVNSSNVNSSKVTASNINLNDQAQMLQYSNSNKITVLQTAKSKIISKGSLYNVTILLDSGSDRSYILLDVAQKANLDVIMHEKIAFSNFGNKSSSESNLRPVFKVRLLGRNDIEHSLNLIGISPICKPLFRHHVPSNMLTQFDISDFSDDIQSDRTLNVDILVGLDHMYDILYPSHVQKHDSLVAVNSVFGWILSGSFYTRNESSVLSQMCCLTLRDDDLEKFWDLETLGIGKKEPKHCLTNSPLIREFTSQLTFHDGHYITSLLFKNKHHKIINNFKIVERRTLSTYHYLDRKPELLKKYELVFVDYYKEVKFVPVPEDRINHNDWPINYLAGFPVIKETSETSKVRPVFDGSAKSYNGLSINDSLETGPVLHTRIFAILLRFRRWKFPVIGDLRQAFLSIHIYEQCQDLCRFLLRVNGVLRHFRWCRLPFGLKCSPFILNSIIGFHLSKYPSDEYVVKELRENFYVDDFLSGADTHQEAHALKERATQIMGEGGFEMTKWQVKDHMKFGEDNVSYVLGLCFDINQDCFMFKGYDLDKVSFSCTKRILLSMIAKLYDPLGLVSPFIMYGKILLRKVWRMDVDWDEILNEDICIAFKSWVVSSKSFKCWTIPRLLFQDINWSDLQDIELHGFGDASSDGCGSVVYIRAFIPQVGYRTAFVTSKSRANPVKGLTIPRLEMLAALLTSRLVSTVKDDLHIPEAKCFYYSDATCVLGWIRSDPFTLKPFISNRVLEIQETTDISSWYHCKGSENPADILSRGCLADDLINNILWLHGPPWLMQNLELDPISQIKLEKSAQVEFNAESKSHALSLLVTSDLNFHISDYSDFSKLLRVVCYILRFTHNASHCYDRMSGAFSSLEYYNAELRIVYLEQRVVFEEEIKCLTLKKPLPKGSPLQSLSPFLDSSGFIRVRPIKPEYNFKLPYESKYPICIPSGHLAKLIINFQHFYLNHSGPVQVFNSLRDRYWIINARRIALQVHNSCVRCQRHNSRSIQQPPCPLPEARVNEAPPFTVSGLDYFSPLYCSDYEGQEFYVLLITCAVSRAVHLELTDSLNLSDCMLALRRFCARRGMPRLFYSDNAPTFVGLYAQMRRIFQIHTPQWRFIPPLSPWYGGWWERIVKSVKHSLRKTLHNTALSRVELTTVLTEIEASINSRPLVYVSNSINDVQALTPSHFLIGRVAGAQPSVSLDESEIGPDDLQLAYTLKQSTLSYFWDIWYKEYVRNLPNPSVSTRNVTELKIGDIVLLKDAKQKRLKWPLGRIVKLYRGKDNVIRCVDVRTAEGKIFNRSVQMLHLLEIYGSDELVPESEETSDEPLASNTDPSDPDNIIVPNNSDHIVNVSHPSDEFYSVPDPNVFTETAGDEEYRLLDVRGSQDGYVGSPGEVPTRSARRAESVGVDSILDQRTSDQLPDTSDDRDSPLPVRTSRFGRPLKPRNRLNL